MICNIRLYDMQCENIGANKFLRAMLSFIEDS